MIIKIDLKYMKTKDKKYNDPDNPFKWKHVLGENNSFCSKMVC